MTGIICMWSGAIVDIPDGWLLCDGNNGTPDLRNLFIVGAGDLYNPGDNAAAPLHKHPMDFNCDGEYQDHTHNYDEETTVPFGGSSDYNDIGGIYQDYGTHSHDAPGTTDVQSNKHSHRCDDETNLAGARPPYYALAYIMKT